jgi:hypothetical protein
MDSDQTIVRGTERFDVVCAKLGDTTNPGAIVGLTCFGVMKGKAQKMKVVRLKVNDPLSRRLSKGAVITMSDGWTGHVFHDDGETVSQIRDGEKPNKLFIGHRGFQRHSMMINGVKVMCRSVIVDLAARMKIGASVVTAVDRARLECDWRSAAASARV